MGSIQSHWQALPPVPWQVPLVFKDLKPSCGLRHLCWPRSQNISSKWPPELQILFFFFLSASLRQLVPTSSKQLQHHEGVRRRLQVWKVS